jgi:5'-deoxynucleotidase YfbR-like HD superfamily hydrolase
MEDRKGPFQVCASGRKWWPLDPRPEDFEIGDIAHHLAMTCRYGGATRDFYSVAEHSVLVSRHVDPKIALSGLMHDAAEAVVSDIIRPLKDLPAFDEFRRVEDRVFDVLCERFGVRWNSMIAVAVAVVDRRIVIDECIALIEGGEEYLIAKGYDLSQRLGADIAAFSPQLAEVNFLLRWEELRTGRAA